MEEAKLKSFFRKQDNQKEKDLEKGLEKLGFKKLHSSPQGTHYGHGNIKVRIDPPQGQTTTNHLHVEYGTRKNIINYDKNLMRVDRKSPDAHIPIK